MRQLTTMVELTLAATCLVEQMPTPCQLSFSFGPPLDDFHHHPLGRACPGTPGLRSSHESCGDLVLRCGPSGKDVRSIVPVLVALLHGPASNIQVLSVANHFHESSAAILAAASAVTQALTTNLCGHPANQSPPTSASCEHRCAHTRYPSGSPLLAARS